MNTRAALTTPLEAITSGLSLAYLPAPCNVIVGCMLAALVVVQLGRRLTHHSAQWFMEGVWDYRCIRSVWRRRNDDP